MSSKSIMVFMGVFWGAAGLHALLLDQSDWVMFDLLLSQLWLIGSYLKDTTRRAETCAATASTKVTRITSRSAVPVTAPLCTLA